MLLYTSVNTTFIGHWSSSESDYVIVVEAEKVYLSVGLVSEVP